MARKTKALKEERVTEQKIKRIKGKPATKRKAMTSKQRQSQAYPRKKP